MRWAALQNVLRLVPPRGAQRLIAKQRMLSVARVELGSLDMHQRQQCHGMYRCHIFYYPSENDSSPSQPRRTTPPSLPYAPPSSNLNSPFTNLTVSPSPVFLVKSSEILTQKWPLILNSLITMLSAGLLSPSVWGAPDPSSAAGWCIGAETRLKSARLLMSQHIVREGAVKMDLQRLTVREEGADAEGGADAGFVSRRLELKTRLDVQPVREHNQLCDPVQRCLSAPTSTESHITLQSTHSLSDPPQPSQTPPSPPG